MPTLRSSARRHAVVVACLVTLTSPRPTRAMQQPSPDPTLAPAPAPVAALAIVNARVWTGDPRRPWADAVLVRGERIELVGSSAEVKKRAGSATVVDAKGMMVTPGFVDAHVHFLDGGFALASVQLRDARTKSEFIARIRAFAATVPPGTWILNGDWDHTSWGGELPNRTWIDSVTPDHPVWINRLDGHMNLANSLALARAGITRDTKDVSGGEIVRDRSGEPTGVLKDNAMELMSAAVPAPTLTMSLRALDSAMRYVSERGVTSVHHMGGWNDLAVFERAHAQGALRTRISAAVPLSTWSRLRDTVAARGRGDAWLRIGALKGFVDGSLGSHTAAMLEPFTDAPNDRGLLVNTLEDLYAWTSGADAARLQVMVHAIGDRAIRSQLDIFARVIKENPSYDRRFRIEHAQHIAPADLARFRTLGVIASMQPYHAIDDGRWATKVIGEERAKGTYAFRSLLDQGATLAFGSDWFVAPPTPMVAIYAAVTRRTLDDANPGGWVPEQKITVEQALRAHTSGSARAGFSEQDVGTLAAGMLADLVLIDRDLTRVAPESIRDARVMLTMVGGRVVFDRDGLVH
ncbi:MAG: amidohydrolase [Gemmatimonadaceae bacterium]|nr:amidohydrolase [Gemmatimonadaceae bacterium]